MKKKTVFVHIEYTGVHYDMCMHAYMWDNQKMIAYPRNVQEMPRPFLAFVTEGLDTEKDTSLGCAHTFELQRHVCAMVIAC